MIYFVLIFLSSIAGLWVSYHIWSSKQKKNHSSVLLVQTVKLLSIVSIQNFLVYRSM